MMTNAILVQAEESLLEALRTSTAPALMGLAVPAYIREFQSVISDNNVCILRVYKKGFRIYKRRYPMPDLPTPIIDTAAISKALNEALANSGFNVQSVEDQGIYVTIEMEEKL